MVLELLGMIELSLWAISEMDMCGVRYLIKLIVETRVVFGRI